MPSNLKLVVNNPHKQIEEKQFFEKVVTKISLVKNYCAAEEYHQKYLEKR